MGHILKTVEFIGKSRGLTRSAGRKFLGIEPSHDLRGPHFKVTNGVFWECSRFGVPPISLLENAGGEILAGSLGKKNTGFG